MKFWQAVSFAEVDQLLDIAVIAEEVGMEGIMISDHMFYPGDYEANYPYSEDGKLAGFTAETPWPDPWVAISAMATVTKTIKFTTMIYIMPLRNPIEVAKSTASLGVFSNNRFALGAGAGWMKEEFDVMGVDLKGRGKRLDEQIEVLKKLWSGEMVEHHGDFYDFPSLCINPVPSQTVPIWVGGISKPALRRAARLGDGWLGSGHTPDEAVDLLNQLTALRKEYGRQNEEFTAIAPLSTPPNPDDLKKIEDAGAAGTVSYPFTYTIGPTSTLEQKRAYLEGFSSAFIQ